MIKCRDYVTLGEERMKTVNYYESEDSVAVTGVPSNALKLYCGLQSNRDFLYANNNR